MSSPFLGPYNGPSSRSAASSPRLAPRDPRGPSKSSEDVSVRLMKLKVLYTFDNENKTNCLARWPHNIEIRTAYLDENTQIGVIELKTCIQAIVAASPELVAKLGQDYTVYAYDYSEYDTPLVGQGMLSWVLASSSSTPAAPAHRSKTIVTGRVCKNIIGIFSDSAQETLEVKLRLVPVPTCLQSEYIESMKSYRDISRVMPENFDAQAWTNFLQANPGILQLVSQSRSGSPASFTGHKTVVGIEHVQKLMHQSYTTADQPDQDPPPSDNYPAVDTIEQLPRPLSQASSVHSTAPAKRGRGRPPKPAHQLSGRSRKSRQLQASKPESSEVGYGSNDDQHEEGPNRKRAKVTRVDYPESSGFGRQPELRVAASTAASLRIHHPTAVRPSNHAASSLEGPPREPTPIARNSSAASRPILPARKSNLSCASLAVGESHYKSPYPPSDMEKLPESENDSPESSRAESANTPADFASSPPVFPGSVTAPSSPSLPTFPHEFDSGFGSGSIDELFNDDECRPLDNEDLEVAAQYMRRDDSQLPTATSSAPPHDSGIELPSDQAQVTAEVDKLGETWDQRPQPSTSSRMAVSRAGSSNDIPSLSRSSDGGDRPSLPHRSQTWAGYQEDQPISDINPTSEAGEPGPKMRTRNRTGSGTGEKRKKAIQSKLAESVARGDIPPFCENCGAIETPTWRKAWIKTYTGTPEHVVCSEEEGGIVAWQSLQTDDNGRVCLFRVIKRTRLPTDEDFTDILLCNPCGIWLHTRKCMRPKEVWDKTQGPDGGAGGPRRRFSQAKKEKSGSSSQQSTNGNVSGSSVFVSENSSPADGNDRSSEGHVPQPPPTRRPRASSVHAGESNLKSTRLDGSSAAAALQRAIQSSPIQRRTSQHVDPAGKDLTPKPTRRILFPSPNQRGQRESSQSSAHRPEKNGDGWTDQHTHDNYNAADKENLPPQYGDDERPVFDKTPQRSITPTPTAKSHEMLFKTPNRNSTPDRIPPTTGDFFSSAAKALLRPQTTSKNTFARSEPLSELSPFTAQLNSILSDANVASPSGSDFDLIALPSLGTPDRIRRDIDIAQFDPMNFLSTDIPMPSSPPVEGWFGVYEDPAETDGNFWDDYPFLGSSPPAPASQSSSSKKTKKPTALSVDQNGRASVDFVALANTGG
ncbi:MAG: hypothetical protein Q9219_001393 [cf. Caloplaca sp. 3 TL-2023]